MDGDIAEANRIAAKSNLRSGKDRRVTPTYVVGSSKRGFVYLAPDGRTHLDRRSYRDQRAPLSTFERDMLLSPPRVNRLPKILFVIALCAGLFALIYFNAGKHPNAVNQFYSFRAS